MLTDEITRLDRSFVETSSFGCPLADLTATERLFSRHSVVSRPEPEPRIVQVRARGETVNFKYLDSAQPRPIWFMEVLQGFANLVTLTDGWDGSGAARIDRATINRALGAIE